LSTEEEANVHFELRLLTQNYQRSKTVLSERVQTLDKSTEQVGCHKSLGEFVLEFVVTKVNRISFLVEVFPEPWNCNRSGIVVGIGSLPFVHNKLAWREQVKWVWPFLFFSCKLILFFLRFFLNEC
jgi:hypothetical protein